MKGKQGETQETPRRVEREKRTNKRRSWVSESGTLPPFIGSIHAPAPCARPRKAGRSPRPYPLVPRSMVRRHRLVVGKQWTSLACSGSLHLMSDALYSPCMFHVPCCWFPATNPGLFEGSASLPSRVYYSTHVRTRAEISSLTLNQWTQRWVSWVRGRQKW